MGSCAGRGGGNVLGGGFGGLGGLPVGGLCWPCGGCPWGAVLALGGCLWGGYAGAAWQRWVGGCRQLVELLVLQLWGSTGALEPAQTLHLGRLATQLGEPELRELLLPDWGALSALGELDGWSPEQVKPWGQGRGRGQGVDRLHDGLSPRCGPWCPPSCGSVG